MTTCGWWKICLRERSCSSPMILGLLPWGRLVKARSSKLTCHRSPWPLPSFALNHPILVRFRRLASLRQLQILQSREPCLCRTFYRIIRQPHPCLIYQTTQCLPKLWTQQGGRSCSYRLPRRWRLICWQTPWTGLLVGFLSQILLSHSTISSNFHGLYCSRTQTVSLISQCMLTSQFWIRA